MPLQNNIQACFAFIKGNFLFLQLISQA